jgi:hypothetical protein
MSRQSFPIVLFAFLWFPLPTASGQEEPHPGNLISRMPWARLEIVFGRLRLTHCRLGQESTVSANLPEKGIAESLGFSAKTADSARLHYQYADSEQLLRVDFEQAASMTLDRVPNGESKLATVRFRQPLRGPTTLVVEDGRTTREFSADGLWQLMLAEPEVWRQHLSPILQSLRPDWMLEAQSQQIEQALLAASRGNRAPDAVRMAALVQQLRDPSFSRRQDADHQLREMGQAVVSSLNRLDERTLDAEQRSRIRQIKQSLHVYEGDTPARVAAWLVDDRAVWLALLERKNEATRSIAAGQLETILGQSLAFIPAAGEAERQQQVRRLRAELGLERPLLVGDAGGGLPR